MRSLPLDITAILAIGTALAAQQPTYSPSYALGQINSNNIWPHATSPMRYMQIHDDWTFTSTGPTLVRGLAYRPSNQTSYLNLPAASVEVMIRIGLAATGVTSQTPNASFDGCFDTTSVKTAVSRKIVNYPNSGTTPEELKVFDIAFPFDSSIVMLYSGTGNRSLVIETRQYSRTGGYAFDFVSDINVIGRGWSLQNGAYAGCKNNAGKVVEHTVATDKLFVGSTGATLTGSSYLATIPAILSIGAQPLSITLPGTSCDIANDLLLILPGVTNATGDFTVTLPIVNDAALHRVSFLSQALFFDQAANPFGIVTSRGLVNGIGAGTLKTNRGILRMQATNANPDLPANWTGKYDNGLVMMFRS